MGSLRPPDPGRMTLVSLAIRCGWPMLSPVQPLRRVTDHEQ